MDNKEESTEPDVQNTEHIVTKGYVKDAFQRMQEDKTNRLESQGTNTSSRFPIAGEISENWRKTEIPIEQIAELNPQVYVGSGTPEEAGSGVITYQLWKRTGDSRVLAMTQALKQQRENLLNMESPAMIRDLNNMNIKMLKKTILGPEASKYPIILLDNNSLILPYVTGQTIDGVRRLLTLIEEYTKGNLRDSYEINCLVGTANFLKTIPYNVLTFTLDGKSIKERLQLLKERNNPKY